MKILEINAVCGKGSTGSICVELADGAIKKGHEAYILYASGKSTYLNSKKIAYEYEIKLNAFMSRITGLNGYGSYSSTYRVISFIKKYNPDVVHLHNVHAHYVNLNLLLKYLAKNDIATVITLHDCWFFTGKCTYYSAKKCYKWKHNCERCPKNREDIPSWLFDRTRKMFRDKKRRFQAIPRLGVIGVSNWITNEAKQSFLGNAKKIEAIYNWIQLDVFAPQNKEKLREKYKISPEKNVVFCISESWKSNTQRYQDLIKFVEMADPNWLVIVAGNIDKDMRDYKNVKKVGYIKGIQKLAEYYNLADVYVHFSREDTFGKVIGEAMACGTPIVAYDTTVYSELIKDVCGYVVKEGDIDSVCVAISNIQKKGKAHYSDECLKCSKRFEVSHLIDETIRFYEEL